MANPVELIPWDFESREHIERLIEQRKSCGWHEDMVPAWVKWCRDVKRCFFWVILTDTSGINIEDSPELEPLNDTCRIVRGTPRQPSDRTFRPIGHIALDLINDRVTHLPLNLPPTNCYWINSFFISPKIRGRGLGRHTMTQIERLATAPPLEARTFALGTWHRDFQTDPHMIEEVWDGVKPLVNQDWYAKQGYKAIYRNENEWPAPGKEGRIWSVPSVYMRKDLV